ncbi:retrovirus-related pol polyprotein from transposon TNT 1-94 [Tanacetum coccineum]
MSKKSKEVLEVLKQEFQGDVKVRAIKQQTLKRDYENKKMKENKSLNDYSSRLTDLINQMKKEGVHPEVVAEAEVLEVEYVNKVTEVLEVETILTKDHLAMETLISVPLARNTITEKKIVGTRETNVERSDTLFLDNGCSNHMTGDESILVDIDTIVNSQVKIGNGTSEGKRQDPSQDKSRYEEHTALKATTANEALLWHMRLGHLNFQSINLLHQKNMVEGLP